jgi:hypothetical protein
VAVSGGGAAIADGDDSPSETDGTDFGTAQPGQAPPPTREFTVANAGGAPLNLANLSVPAGFSVVEGLAPSLAPGASDTFTLALDTGARATVAGPVTFTTDDPSHPTFQFAVRGVVGPVTVPPGVLVTQVKPTLPRSVVGGSKKAKGTVHVVLMNTADDTLNGTVTITVTASTDMTAHAGIDLALGAITKSVKLKHNARRTINVRVRVPAAPPGAYFILAAAAGTPVSNGTHLGPAAGPIQVLAP